MSKLSSLSPFHDKGHLLTIRRKRRSDLGTFESREWHNPQRRRLCVMRRSQQPRRKAGHEDQAAGNGRDAQAAAVSRHDAAAAVPDSESSLISCSATFTSSMCWKRRCGSFRRHRRITFSRSLGKIANDRDWEPSVARESPH